MINLYLVWKKQYDPSDERACAREILSSSIVAAKRWYNCTKPISDLQAKLLLKDYDQARKDDEACMDRILSSL